MPFVTEEIYHQLKDRTDDLTVKQTVALKTIDASILTKGTILKTDITAIRDSRVKLQLKNAEQLKFFCNPAAETFYGGDSSLLSLLEKQVNITYLGANIESSKNEITTISSDRKFFLQLEKEIDTAAQKEQLLKDLDYQKGFLISVEKKLSNERFVQNAKPDIVEIEKKKKADAEAKIKAIEESLALL